MNKRDPSAMRKTRQARKDAGLVYYSVQVTPDEKEALKERLKELRTISCFSEKKGV